MERLLTEEELSKYEADGISLAGILKQGNVLKVNIDAILTEQDAKTLKAVGEWLEKKPWIVKKGISVGLKGITPYELNTLLNGEMPEEKP